MRTIHEITAGLPLGGQVSAIVHPDQVLHHPRLTIAEKRELLARWVSDACAVEDAPSLRRLDSGAIVKVADLLLALQELPSEESGKAFQQQPLRPGARRGRPLFTSWRKSPRRTDDDDPPSGGAALRLAPAYSIGA